MDQNLIQARVDGITGGVLLTSPFWIPVLQSVNFIAGVIASVCGAVLGIHAVWRLIRNRGNTSNAN